MRMNDRQLHKKIFIWVMGLSFIGLLLTAYISRGMVIGQTHFDDTADAFMDYFNCLRPGSNPYQSTDYLGILYPPLALLIFRFLGHLMPADLVNSYSFNDNRYILRSYPLGPIEYFTFMMLTVLVCYIFIRMMLKNNGKRSKWIALMIVFSAPFLYTYERGNILILALAGSLIFLWGYDSENRVIRYLSLFALAVASAIKIYPAILGMLLVRDRRWKDAFILVGMGLAAFLLPFLAFEGGFANIQRFLKALADSMAYRTASSMCGRFDFSGIISTACRLLKINSAVPVAVIKLALMGASCAIVVFNRKLPLWKAVSLLSAQMIIFPDFSYAYTLTFFALGLILFLADNSEERGMPMSLVYTCLFLIVFTPMLNGPRRIRSTLLVDLGLYGIVFLIIIEEVIALIRNRKMGRIVRGGSASLKA